MMSRPIALHHQNEVGGEHRHGLALDEGMHHAQAEVVAGLFRLLQRFLGRARSMRRLDIPGELFVGLGHLLSQWMVDGHGAKGHAEYRVVTRRENLQLAGGLVLAVHQIELELQTFRAANPVALHGAYLLRPPFQSVEGLEQLLRHVRDLEKPLGEFALLHLRSGAPALAVDHLLVCEHGLVDRVPVDLGAVPRDETFLEEVKEQFLLLSVIVRIAGREFPRPVERKPQRLELGAHGVDVGIGPFGRMHAALDSRVLCRYAECVPAHRVQHAVAAGALVARHHVAHGVVADMAHVDAPGRVGEHLQHVIFRALAALACAEQILLVPDALPVGLTFARVVTRLRHDASSLKG
jgi:hypothetical protein